jgi:hypothetical protein
VALRPRADDADTSLALVRAEGRALGRLDPEEFEAVRPAVVAFVSSWATSPAARIAFPELVAGAATGARAALAPIFEALPRATALDAARALAAGDGEDERLSAIAPERSLAPAFTSLADVLEESAHVDDVIAATRLYGQALRVDAGADISVLQRLQHRGLLGVECVRAGKERQAIELFVSTYRLGDSHRLFSQDPEEAQRTIEALIGERPADWAPKLAVADLVSWSAWENRPVSSGDLKRARELARAVAGDPRVPLAARGFARFREAILVSAFADHGLEPRPAEAAALVEQAHDDSWHRDKMAADAARLHAEAWLALGHPAEERAATEKWAALALEELRERLSSGVGKPVREGGVPFAAIADEDSAHQVAVKRGVVHALVTVRAVEAAARALDGTLPAGRQDPVFLSLEALVALASGRDDEGTRKLREVVATAAPGAGAQLVEDVTERLAVAGFTAASARARAVR